MAGLLAILTALWRLSWRELEALRTLTANNFFIAGALLLSGSGPFLWIVLGLLLLFPISADPLSRAPAERILSWPLPAWKRIGLRVFSLILSPPAWIVFALLVWAQPSLTLAFIALVAAIQTVRALSSHRPALSPLKLVEADRLITKNLRQLLLFLDTWLALLLALCGLFTREKEVLLALTCLAVVALSTMANCLFALDLPGGFTRYALYPIPGWRVLAAKDAAFLLLAVLVTAPLNPLGGMSGALTALAIGHHFSTRYPLPAQPWRFASGTALVPGILQSMAAVAATVTTGRQSVLFLALPLTAWAASLWFYSRFAPGNTTPR
ncbi:MAG: hypothetical protein IT168_08890 [Bryobacterales bacterium]|nr:hypothetical protein [Bryobacterales bacterium]